jgi:hypothetical protein
LAYPRIQRPGIRFAHQLSELCGEIFPNDQIGIVTLYSQGRSDCFDARKPAAARELKGSFYRIHTGRHA